MVLRCLVRAMSDLVIESNDEIVLTIDGPLMDGPLMDEREFSEDLISSAMHAEDLPFLEWDLT